MDVLKRRILSDGQVLPNDILKVDHFLNHQIDPALIMAMGEDFYNHFKDQNIHKILTIEASGIALAFAAATLFDVPLVFAKKTKSLLVSDDVYSATIVSYTKQTSSKLRVNRQLLKKQERILIIDDFLAMGEALGGLMNICQQADAEVVGAGIAIEKAFQPGGQKFRQQGYHIYSQAKIEKFDGDKVVFC